MESASPTALNPTIEQACSQGIKVVVFDQLATAPCTYAVKYDSLAYARDMFAWLAASLDGKGNIIVDRGLPGSSEPNAMYALWQDMAENEYPDINIIGSYASEFADGPEQQGVSQLAAKDQNIDGLLTIWSCKAAGEALAKSGIKGIPMGCNLANGNAEYCEANNLPCFLYGGSAMIGGIATERAIEFALGDAEFEEGGSELAMDTNFVSSKALTDFDHKQELDQLKDGYSVFPGEPGTLSTPVTWGDWNIKPADVLGD
jgi:ribose transport system substrate-binding protein